MGNMSIELYQQLSKRTVPKDTHERLVTNFIIGLNEEAGEVASPIKKHLYQGHILNREEVKKELGDVMFYAFNLASELDIDMMDVFEANVEKLRKRYPDGFDKNKSVNRVE